MQRLAPAVLAHRVVLKRGDGDLDGGSRGDPQTGRGDSRPAVSRAPGVAASPRGAAAWRASGAAEAMRAQRAIPEGIRITRVGLWYVLLTVLVAVAATNTGNNALYLVLALMLALLVVSGIVSRQNLRGFDVAVQLPEEIFAGEPVALGFELTNRARFWPRWLVQVSLVQQEVGALVPHLAAGGTSRGSLSTSFSRRGPQTLGFAHLASLFPLGLFRKGMRLALDEEALVYPRLVPAPRPRSGSSEIAGERGRQRRGSGHELYALRFFQSGDDPRGVHWKQTAKTGVLIYMEREAETGRRVAVLLDNAVGPLAAEDEDRFEVLVGEAASVALEHLDRGFEVALATRDASVPFGSGLRHRRWILETLARVEARPAQREALLATWGGTPVVRLELDRDGEGAA